MISEKLNNDIQAGLLLPLTRWDELLPGIIVQPVYEWLIMENPEYQT
ncbi:MAG: hypothetical protein JEZ11_01665 [Desulfobacterales bacterium]|nr:hypothetical protein [Desulfobacterales bacterium]